MALTASFKSLTSRPSAVVSSGTASKKIGYIFRCSKGRLSQCLMPTLFTSGWRERCLGKKHSRNILQRSITRPRETSTVIGITSRTCGLESGSLAGRRLEGKDAHYQRSPPVVPIPILEDWINTALRRRFGLSNKDSATDQGKNCRENRGVVRHGKWTSRENTKAIEVRDSGALNFTAQQRATCGNAARC